MHIALDVSSASRPEATGVAVYIRRLVEGLGKVGSDHHFTLMNRLSRWKHRKKWVAPPAPNFHSKAVLEPFHPFFGRSVDVFHGLDARLPGPWMKSKLVVTIHDVFSALQSKEFATEEFRKLKAKRYQDIVDRADRIICVSEACKKDVLETIEPDPQRIRVVYEAAGPGFGLQPAEEVSKTRTKFGLEGPYVIYVGTINRRKNVANMIHAFMRAKEQTRSDAVFAIAGRIGFGGSDIQELLEKATSAGHVKLLGYIPNDDIPRIYCGATALLFATLYEGFGIPAVEAMSCGCPVIGGSKGSVPEILAGAGLIADPENVDDIAQQICELLTNEETRQQLRTKGLKRAGFFSWEKAAQGCLDIYSEIA